MEHRNYSPVALLTLPSYFILGTLVMAESSLASTFSVGLSGSAANSNVQYETQAVTSGTASLSISLGSHISLGVAGTQYLVKSQGWRIKEPTPGYYVPYKFTERQTTKKIDARGTFIFYNGLVTPFIFGGVANVSTVVDRNNEGEEPVHIIQSTKGTPTYGYGISINLSQRFSMKITQTYTIVEVPDLESTKKFYATDTYAQVGINYNFL